jgi:hypothetical protein
MTRARHIFAWISRLTDSVFRDGLDTTAYIERIEHEFSIRIDDENTAQLKTLGDLCEYIARQRAAQERALTGDAIWAAVRRITSDEFGVAETELHRQIRFVKDLKC